MFDIPGEGHDCCDGSIEESTAFGFARCGPLNMPASDDKCDMAAAEAWLWARCLICCTSLLSWLLDLCLLASWLFAPEVPNVIFTG
jgi:hypothetical protein